MAGEQGPWGEERDLQLTVETPSNMAMARAFGAWHAPMARAGLRAADRRVYVQAGRLQKQ